MRQVTVYVSHDLEARVVHALDHADIDGYVRVAGATGTRFAPPGQLPRTVTWEATLFLVPAADEGQVRRIVEELREFAGTCEVEPCLRIVVADVVEVH
jgi:hypothetical protein